jgi:hypothetical protein
MLYLTGDSGEPQLYNREIALQLVRCDKKAETAGIRFGRCQLTLTLIPREVSQARPESAEEAEEKGGEKVD